MISVVRADVDHDLVSGVVVVVDLADGQGWGSRSERRWPRRAAGASIGLVVDVGAGQVGAPGEWVPRRPGDKLVPDPTGQSGSRLVKKCRGRRGFEAHQSPLRKTRSREIATIVIPRAEQQHHTLGLQPTRHKDQSVGRWSIKPLSVIDQTEKALAGRHLGNQGEHGDRDQKGVVVATGGQTERGAERCGLRRRQRGKLVQNGIEQLVQRGERQAHF